MAIDTGRHWFVSKRTRRKKVRNQGCGKSSVPFRIACPNERGHRTSRSKNRLIDIIGSKKASKGCKNIHIPQTKDAIGQTRNRSKMIQKIDRRILRPCCAILARNCVVCSFCVFSLYLSLELSLLKRN